MVLSHKRKAETEAAAVEAKTNAAGVGEESGVEVGIVVEAEVVTKAGNREAIAVTGDRMRCSR